MDRCDTRGVTEETRCCVGVFFYRGGKKTKQNTTDANFLYSQQRMEVGKKGEETV